MGRMRKREKRISQQHHLLVRVFTFVVCFMGTLHMLSVIQGFDEHIHDISACTADTLLQLSELSPPLLSNPPSATVTPENQGKPEALSPPLFSEETKIRDSLLQIPTVDAEEVWKSLLQEGTELLSSASFQPEQKDKKLVGMEVGMHRAVQCVQAARAGLEAHCVEPSPPNFQRVKSGVRRQTRQSPEIRHRIHLHQKAAGAVSGLMLNFSAGGSTGDHVGDFDVWTMKALPEQQADNNTVQVPSVRLDDIVKGALNNAEERVFVLKIDTQGYEPAVFAGLTESVFQQQRIDYILFEYWPKGMDLMSSVVEPHRGIDTQNKACMAAELLESLQKAGYLLYALPNTAHPAAPNSAKNAMKQERAPMENARDNCRYYYELEERFSDNGYQMGYWSDVLAVAPAALLPEKPVTKIGQILQEQQQPTPDEKGGKSS